MNASIISANPSGRIPEPHWLVAFLRLVPDPRVNRTKKHALPDLLMAALCAGLCGYSSFYDMEDFCRVHLDWLRRYCPFAGGVPSHDTFRRVLGLVSPLHFGNVFVLWAKLAGASPGGGQIAIDGKALRRALGADGHVPYIVNAFSTKAHLVLGQLQVLDKENEIVAIPRLLDLLDVRGALVSIDAIGCQTRIAAKIRRKGGDYLLALKANQPAAFEEMRAFMLDAVARGEEHLARAHTIDKEHGRFEERTCWVSPKIDWFADLRKWPGLACVVMVESRRTVKGVTTTEQRYYLSSRHLSAAEALEAVRAHWGVETLHWVLDIVMDEDHSRTRTGHAPENLAILRRLAVNILRRERDSDPPDQPPRRYKALRLAAACNENFLERLLAATPPPKTACA